MHVQVMLVQVGVGLIPWIPAFVDALRGKVYQHGGKVWRWSIKLTLTEMLSKWWDSTDQIQFCRESVVADMMEAEGRICGRGERFFARHVRTGVAINASRTLCEPPDGLKGPKGHVTARLPCHGLGYDGWRARGLKARRPTI